MYICSMSDELLVLSLVEQSLEENTIAECRHIIRVKKKGGKRTL